MLVKILLWIWQLPQNIIGFLMSRKAEYVGCVSSDNNYPVYFVRNVFGAGVCLGDYILVDYQQNMGKSDRTNMKHEYGHHKQSLMLGWFYLLIVGFPSLVRNIYDRLFHKNMSARDRKRWYYRGFPERQADILGEVTRI